MSRRRKQEHELKQFSPTKQSNVASRSFASTDAQITMKIQIERSLITKGAIILIM
uniref:Uncharacterized protein n=1 Tax=Rhizophora mucronata TaxID=61149 RepID=A0A2P2NQN7_RHIMU